MDVSRVLKESKVSWTWRIGHVLCAKRLDTGYINVVFVYLTR